MRSTTTDNDRYMDLKTLAEYSGMPVRTIRDYLSDAENPIPNFALKRKIFVRKNEFDKWMESHRTDTRQQDKIVDEIIHELCA